MGSLSDLLIAKGQDKLNQGTDIANDITSGVAAGVQLATAKEQIEQKKAQTEAMKADLTIKQASTVNSLLTNLAKANPMIAKKMLPQIREKLIGLGASPDIADYTISDDANRARQVLYTQMFSGKMGSNPDMAYNYLQTASDPSLWDSAHQEFDIYNKNKAASALQAGKNATDIEVAKINAQAKVDSAGIRLGPQEERIHNTIIKEIQQDDAVKKRSQQIANLNNAVSNFQRGDASPQDFAELQQAVRANLGIKGQSTGNERSDAYLHSLGLSAAEFKQFLTSDTANVNNYTPQFVSHIMSLVNNELNNAQGQLKTAVEKHTKGHESFYSRRPELKNDLMAYAEGTIKQSDIPPAGSAAPPAPQGFDPNKLQEAINRKLGK